MLGSPTGLDEPINRQPPAAPPVEATSTEVLISTQQVLFGTAAALGAHRKTDPQRRHYPKRYGFLENALMAREMERL
ncbi:hypothetical protein AWB91_09990 [Mycobacterium paraense]|uniref:Uncharacterized protein n=1 Tax=Mycobacterium paraense TaxID=767916 RepID=A0A1X2A704_9MYCO|nr:hypothetical protein [Mycobacterium paraense]MCV7444190.1 hypothetical protein [Mycobacterium paraense]ORW32803.1 hypothetical protein AWB91_09990 [Mycobacterium paraense]ORW43059.1 hypothetical protein AWB90_18035 [Mycobacterium paraense]ORW44453.1 hypothetical protein AWB89_15290 [Mycobacterium paraense]ORW45029.1 hypothetical protein AWB88_05065 [Mycobacterium paraense]